MCGSSELDNSYWSKEMRHPYSPSASDAGIFKSLLFGRVLLLGCTHKLIQLSDVQIDHDPWYDGPNVVKKDWRENDSFFDTIIGDGVLNLDCDLSEAVVEMASKHSKRLVVRWFSHKLPLMKVARCFDRPKQPPSLAIPFDGYSFLLWDFK